MIVPRTASPYLGARWCILCDCWKPLDDMAVEFGKAKNGRIYGSGVCLSHKDRDLSPRQRTLMQTAHVEFDAA